MTAVEWLQEALEDTILTKEQIMQTIGLFEQAKELEMEQIFDAWDDGAYGCGQFTTTHDNSEQYYNETYKQD